MAGREATADLVEFDGMIDSIRFVGDSGFAVLSVRPLNVKDIGMNLVTVAGVLFEPRRKDKIKIEGEWTTHPRFGLQVKANHIQMVLPDTEKGVYELLKAKKFLPGVGEKTAKLLAENYGGKIFEVLEKNPEDLLNIRGISKKKLEKIVGAYKQKSEMRNILQFCAIHGIPQGQGEKIFEVYGGSAVSILTRNPYLLTETNRGIKGIGFKKADAMAMKQGIPKDSMDRITHGLLFEVNELTSKKGSTAVPRDTLLKESAEMMELETSQIEPWLETMLAEDNPRIVQDSLNGKDCIWNKFVYEREKNIARKIFILRDEELHANIPHDIDHAIDVAETSNGIKLADSQRKALLTALRNKFCVITGGPGVGKTTITRCLINILERAGNEVQCAAPTGRASKRMKEATGHDAVTIHRLLEFSSESEDTMFKRNATNPLDGDVVIIDESSMVDCFLMDCLLEAIPRNAMVIFIGDVDQLPSVGAGKVLQDLIESKSVAVSRLTTIFRQAATSKIITAAHSVNKGYMPEIENNPNDDFFFIETKDNVRCASCILRLVDYIPKKFGCDPLWDVQVLSPKKGSEVGTERLNAMIQAHFIPETDVFRKQHFARNKQKHGLPLTHADEKALSQTVSTPMIMGESNIFALGDKVMQIVNNYGKDVFNGEVGVIDAVYPTAKREDFCVSIQYPDEENGSKSVWYTRDELFSQVSLSYACTIHKSQGSEYKFVIIPVMPTFSIMLQRKLIYTGITRGKKLVTMVGSKESFEHAIKNYFRSAVGTRHTKLKYWLSHPSELVNLCA